MASDFTAHRPEWVMPQPPVPGALATYYGDGNEVWLHWVYPKGHFYEFQPVRPEDGACEIPWPFGFDSIVGFKSFEALGFVDVETLGD